MKQAVEVKVVEYERPRYGKVCTIARLFDMDRTTVWAKLEAMRKEGCYDDVVIEEGPKNRRINIAKFEEYLKSKHLKYLRA
ncbi:hypothetical protein [Veillonella montpellierensis]|uniref:hypothetical protein n=1 Tax=Veillonella montpellierensis TaxID=187328 RepID=UPI0023F9A135|nr:hypothetical protein [Veillonella montpellierensis]